MPTSRQINNKFVRKTVFLQITKSTKTAKIQPVKKNFQKRAFPSPNHVNKSIVKTKCL